MIQAFEQMLDGGLTEEKKAKVLELVNDMDGEKIYNAITDGL